MNRSQLAGKLKGQICEFSGKLCKGLPKVVGRFVGFSTPYPAHWNWPMGRYNGALCSIVAWEK